MPLIVRLGQHTLRVLGCYYIEATGAVESSRKVHRVAWKYQFQYNCCRRSQWGIQPVESMLLVAPNPTPWRASRSYLYRWIKAVELEFPQSRLEEYMLPIRPVLRDLPLTTSADNATGSNRMEGFGSSTVDLNWSVGLEGLIRMPM